MSKLNRFSGSDDKVDIVKFQEKFIPENRRLEDIIESYPEPSADDFNREVREMHKRILESDIASNLTDDDIAKLIDKDLKEKRDIKELDKWRKESLNEELRYLYKEHPELTFDGRPGFARHVMLKTFENRLGRLKRDGSYDI